MTEVGQSVSRLRHVTAQLLLAALLATSFAGVEAKGLFGGDDEDDAAKAKAEWAVALPVFPKEEDLLPFYAGPMATLEFAVDPKSIAVGSDEVRYTLVTSSKSGARTISYEGLRCSSFEMKRYAFGQKDGKWTLARDDKWVPIQFYSSNRPQAALAQDYFCLERTIEGKAEDMRDRIRYNRSLLGNTYRAN